MTINSTASSLGAQRPRVLSLPEGAVSSLGQQAIELAAMAGLYLDEWQKFVLSHALSRRADGKWSAFEIGLLVSRQNGKGSLIEARELAGLFLLGERFIIHSAHQFDTSLEAYRRLRFLIENTPELDKRVNRYMNSHGEEGIELKSGQRIRFRTRTKGGGRGFSANCVILDEAMYLPEAMMGALMFTVSAMNPKQLWYTGSAVDQTVQEDGVVFARLRQRGHEGKDPSLAYFEWSIDQPNPSDVPLSLVNDEAAWAESNPALGVRIDPEHIANEQRSMSARTFAVERLGVGDWPSVDGAPTVIDMNLWAALTDDVGRPVDPVQFAFDVAQDRSWASIAAAGNRRDGYSHLEVIERRRGTGWVTERLVELTKAHKTCGPVVCVGAGATSLLPELKLAGVDVEALTGSDHAKACALLYDSVEQKTLRHSSADDLDAALKGAVQRPLEDAWAWSRKSSSVDISPLVAVTLAFWGLVARAKPIYQSAGFN